MYPTEMVQRFIAENFIPVKIHIKERPQDFSQFKVEWTPTLIILEPDGTERYRFEGYLPPEDFLARLSIGLAKTAFSRGKFEEAENRFSGIAECFTRNEVAPEAMYWSAVSDYKRTGKGDALEKAARTLRSQYPYSDWTKRSSVWQLGDNR